MSNLLLYSLKCVKIEKRGKRMTTLAIILIVLFCVFTVGQIVGLVFYFRAINGKIKANTNSEFLVKKSPLYLTVALVGAEVTLFMLVIFSVFWSETVSYGVYIIFAVLCAICLLIMFALMRERIEVSGENITVVGLLRKKVYKLSQISYKKAVNGDFGYFYYIGDEKAFSVNSYCMGYYNMLEYTADIREYTF